MQRQSSIGLFIAALTVATAIVRDDAHASLPVPYAIVGCITNGSFQSEGASGKSFVSTELKALEGKTARLEGLLSPGDHFVASALYIVHEQCRADLHRRYFLCNPCQTILNAPPSQMLPRDERSPKLELSPAALKEFDGYPHSMRR